VHKERAFPVFKLTLHLDGQVVRYWVGGASASAVSMEAAEVRAQRVVKAVEVSGRVKARPKSTDSLEALSVCYSLGT
jgi:hypothetical protein